MLIEEKRKNGEYRVEARGSITLSIRRYEPHNNNLLQGRETAGSITEKAGKNS